MLFDHRLGERENRSDGAMQRLRCGDERRGEDNSQQNQERVTNPSSSRSLRVPRDAARGITPLGDGEQCRVALGARHFSS
jgi:hypothetical protein